RARRAGRVVAPLGSGEVSPPPRVALGDGSYTLRVGNVAAIPARQQRPNPFPVPTRTAHVTDHHAIRTAGCGLRFRSRCHVTMERSASPEALNFVRNESATATWRPRSRDRSWTATCRTDGMMVRDVSRARGHR